MDKKNIAFIATIIVTIALVTLALCTKNTDQQATETTPEQAQEFDVFDPTNWDTYTNEEYGISIKYPPNTEYRIDEISEENGDRSTSTSITFMEGPLVTVRIGTKKEGDDFDVFNTQEPYTGYGRKYTFCGTFNIHNNEGILYCNEHGGQIEFSILNYKDTLTYNLHFRSNKWGEAYATAEGIRDLISLPK